MKSVFRILCFVAAAACAVFGIGRLGRGDEDAELRTALSGEYAYLKERQVGAAFGYHASEYWRIVVLHGDQALWDRLMEASRTFGMQAEIERQVKSAIAAEFSVPADPKRDQMIREDYYRLASRAPELRRRQAFSQRLKDCLASIGAASIFGLVGWLLLIPLSSMNPFRERIPRDNGAQ